MGEEKLTKKLSEDAGSMVSHNSSSILADICKEKLLPVDDGDGDQSILDDHVSRVWTDKTPLRSPGDPSGRPRSPGFSRRGRSAAPRQSSTGHASSNPHRTLPGRVPRVGPHRDSSSGPIRNVAAHPSGPVYHQDLAYYEIDSRVSAASRMQGMIPHQLESGQTNDRVMEWMLDVERSGGAASHDQRSGSSKGATKTSPRSKARHGVSSHSHRAVSQERIQMSNSWSGHPASGGLHYQAQMEAEAKRRLGASMAMPPPSQSNNSTLRKAAGQTRVPQGANPADITVAVYTFSHEKGEVMPYRVKIPIKPVTLRLVKDYLPKKGAFRFYFKTEVDGDMCYEEETEDASLVPLWEGKVLVQCRLLD